MDSQDYLELSVCVPDEQTGDIVVAACAEIGCDSFLYEDGVQKCYIPGDIFDEDAFISALAGIVEFLDVELNYEIKPMPKVNWNAEWEKSGFTPIECGDFVVLSAGSGESAANPIYLDPQMAFGTGHHHTTFMMMQAMQDMREKIEGASVMDLGCGTAVLAILAARLGAAQVAGIDIDAVAVRSAEENVRLNGLTIPIICGDDSAMREQAYDVILANIHKNIIIAGLPVYERCIRPEGRLLISGFFTDDADEILNDASAHGFQLEARYERDGWCCCVLAKEYL